MRQWLSILLSLAVAAAAMGAAARLVAPINRERGALHLNWTELDDTLPPEMALTQAALGTFRGLAINALWQRANELKQEGRYHEAMQLSNWITTLQPRFPQVWEFNAWNMAYNISVATYTPDERWMWVDAGVRLLRDRGIAANPQSLRLYDALGWILLHKIGDDVDEMHWHYKARFAAEWHALLGVPPVTMGKYEPWMHRIVLAADPQSQELSRCLREQMHMDPATMLALAREYGPLDWRHPASHALYWAWVGRQQAASSAGRAAPERDTTRLQRLTFSSLQQLTHKGRILWDEDNGSLAMLPDPRFMDAYERAFVTALREDPELGRDHFETGYRNFSEWALRLCYVYGERTEAERRYERLRSTARPGQGDRYTLPLDDFVARDMLENLSGPDDARQVIAGQVFQGLLHGFGRGDRDTGARFLQTAQNIHRWYMRTQEKPDEPGPLRLGSFSNITASVTMQLLMLPPQQLDPISKIRIWQNLPADLRGRIPTWFRQQLITEAGQHGLDGEQAYALPGRP